MKSIFRAAVLFCLPMLAGLYQPAFGADDLDSLRLISDHGSSATCEVCHQMPQSTPSVNAAITGMDEDTPSADLRFINAHARAATAVLYGAEVIGAFEYDGKDYRGTFAHIARLDTCTDCHDPDNLEVALEDCVSCHRVNELRAIRTSPLDYDGDGDIAEGISGEIESLHQILGQAIQAYAAQITGAPVVYAADVYPYFFNDTNGNGIAEPDETIFPNRYASWTPRLLKAAYNYQYIACDPGIYCHNPHYAIQILLDSLDSLSEKISLNMPDVSRP